MAETQGRAGRLAGKVAIVTGAGGGIGRAIAARFVACGARVLCTDVDADAARAAAADAGEGAAARVCDVAREADAEAAVAEAVSRFGGLSVLVNNAAAFLPDATVAEIAEADWQRVLAVNLTGAFLMSKHAVPAMERGGGGSIIHMASQHASVGRPGRSWYCAAKAGLVGLAKAMALDHAAAGIRVNALSPGPILTARIERRYGGAAAAHAIVGARTALDRMGHPEEIAEAAVFLASDEASFMTGADMIVDGGYTAQ